MHGRTGPEDSNRSKIDLFRLVWMMLWWLKGVEEKLLGANTRTVHYLSDHFYPKPQPETVGSKCRTNRLIPNFTVNSRNRPSLALGCMQAS
jgi:hypothetical protein